MQINSSAKALLWIVGNALVLPLFMAVTIEWYKAIAGSGADTSIYVIYLISRLDILDISKVWNQLDYEFV